MAIASLPSIGVIVIAGDSGPCVSLNICHPLASLDRSTGTILVARPATPVVGASKFPPETLFQVVSILKGKLAETPEPPPPEVHA